MTRSFTVVFKTGGKLTLFDQGIKPEQTWLWHLSLEVQHRYWSRDKRVESVTPLAPAG